METIVSLHLPGRTVDMQIVHCLYCILTGLLIISFLFGDSHPKSDVDIAFEKS